MKRYLGALVAFLVVAAPITLALTATPANAWTSKPPTADVYNAAPGKGQNGERVWVWVNRHGSKVLDRTTTIWQNGHRVHDRSPRPGVFKVKTVFTYRITIHTPRKRVWVPWDHCNTYSHTGLDLNDDGDYDDEVYPGVWEFGPSDGCAPGGWGEWQRRYSISWSSKKRTTDWDTVRIRKISY